MLRRALPFALAAVATAAACGATPTRPPPDDAPGGQLTGCVPDVPVRGFKDSLANKLGSPRHVADDVIVGVGQPITIEGKFHYGKVGKDLEDEDVTLLVAADACGPWTPVDTRSTDDDGRVRFERVARSAPELTHVQMVAVGDGSRAITTVRVVAPGTRAVLFDVDGTLTQDDGELFEDLTGGTAEAWPGAADVAHRWHGLGYQVVYITGRPYALREGTRQWLAAKGFPSAPLITVDRWRDAIPSRGKVGEFKRTTISALIASGLVFEAAYGNAATDVCAYAEAGIDPRRTFITGTDPKPCDAYPPPNTLPSYVDHLPTLANQPPAPAP
jgi:phosphatidate phosphatase PAH1